jgi:hypothetical protein
MLREDKNWLLAMTLCDGISMAELPLLNSIRISWYHLVLYVTVGHILMCLCDQKTLRLLEKYNGLAMASL